MKSLWTKPIRTYGETITPEQQAAAWRDWIRSPAWWLHRWSLEQLLIQQGVSIGAYSASGKMIQIARKAGVIRLWHSRWLLVEPARSALEASHSPDSDFCDARVAETDSAVHGPLSAQREAIK